MLPGQCFIKNKETSISSLYQIKPAFQGLLRPLARLLAGAGVTANQVTLGAVALSAAGGAAVWWGHEAGWPLFAVPVVCVARMVLNAIDGMLAREHGMQSSLGAVLNELGDVVSDAVLYLPFAVVGGVSAPLIVLLVVTGILSEMTGVVAVQIGASRRYDGPLGKSDRAFLFGLIGFLLGAGWVPLAWIDPALVVALALSAVTIWNRGRRALKELDR